MDQILEYWVVEEIEKNKLYEMANLLTRDTGLPAELYVSFRHGNKKEGGIRVKVIDNNASFTMYRDSGQWNIRDVQVNKIGSNGVKQIEDFLNENLWLITKLWNGEVSNDEFTDLIRLGYRVLKDSVLKRYSNNANEHHDKLLDNIVSAVEDIKDKDLAIKMTNQRVVGKLSDDLIGKIIFLIKG